MATRGIPVTYRQLEEALTRAGAALDAAETHGLFCGLMCAAGRLDRGLWDAELFGEAPDPRDVAVGQCLGALGRLADYTREAMHDPGISLQLLLPDDETPLGERADALGAWCEGYLAGLGLGGIREEAIRSEEVKELLQDMAEISKISFDADEAGGEDEEGFCQIVEYLRVGVLLIIEELQPLKAPPRLQ